MASTADFRNGMMIRIDGDICKIVEFQHVKPGKGGAFVRTKLKRVLSGAVVDKTFRAGEKVDEVRVERHKMQYTYHDGNHYHLMNMETYEEVVLDEAAVGDDARYLKEGTELDLMMSEDGPLGMELPTFVVLEVTETDPGFKGDTASGGNKPATMETGLVVQVPLFIEMGERLKIDTRTGEYIERVKS